MTSNPYNVNVENMRAWIADLRTTTAPQALGTLATVVDADGTVGYCCLGRQAACVLGEATPQEGKFGPLTAFPGGIYQGTALPDSRTLSALATPATDYYDLFGTHRTYSVDTVVLATVGDPLFPSQEDLDAAGHRLLNDRLTAAEANDDLGWSFAQIADALESRYLPDDYAATLAGRK